MDETMRNFVNRLAADGMNDCDWQKVMAATHIKSICADNDRLRHENSCLVEDNARYAGMLSIAATDARRRKMERGLLLECLRTGVSDEMATRIRAVLNGTSVPRVVT